MEDLEEIEFKEKTSKDYIFEWFNKLCEDISVCKYLNRMEYNHRCFGGPDSYHEFPILYGNNNNPRISYNQGNYMLALTDQEYNTLYDNFNNGMEMYYRNLFERKITNNINLDTEENNIIIKTQKREM